MARKHHYRRRTKEPVELDMTTFLNLMVVLVPFLLITAVFSRITIVELSLPSSNSGAASSEPAFRVEVVVREEGFELTNGTAIIATIPKVDEEYDMATLSDYLLSLKREYPDEDSASVLLEPEIPYDYLIQVMDVVRSAELPAGEGVVPAVEDSQPLLVEDDEFAIDGEAEQQFTRVALFTDIAIGDAP
jgi:biopolymer transport protein ExbD